MKAKFFITLGLLLAVLATIATFGIYIETANASSNNSIITANVAVGNVIYLSVAAQGGNTINFGSLFTLDSYYTDLPVTDTDSGGNIGANILVSGTSWALTSNTAVTFSVGNTLWNPTSLTSYAGNALTTSFVNTNDIIVAPTLSNPTTSNNIYFGLYIPAGTAPGNYVQTISFEDYNASQNIYNSITASGNAITAMADVQGTCYIALSTNTISFGSIVSNADVPTNVLVTDTDNGGNVASSLLVEGNDWTQTSNSLTTFGVGNTKWDATSQGSYAGTALTNSLFTTGISIAAPNTLDTTTSNNIYFGLYIPGGTPAGTYSQDITIENSC
ncbi:MAG: hypothetical protein M1128_03250 [Candidatus Marsarchaeota archaeon]|nr:hypothetical protein [Candidatus Marsarchaeota archaeon]